MNNRLEQFVRDNREEFDAEQPDTSRMWEKLQRDLDIKPATPQSPQSAPVFRINRTWLSAAAVLILVIAGGFWFFKGQHSTTTGTEGLAQNQDTKPQSVIPQTDSQEKTQPRPQPLNQQPEAQAPTTQLADVTKKPQRIEPEKTSQESAMDEEMYHYTRLVEIKHKELKAIEKDEPLLYKQFAADVNKLDSVYNGLRKELPKNPNREQLLEAMVQNLQLQMQLLNHQLDIIKQINKSKNNAYEKAYKTI